jgi:hypothetical protein
MSYKHLSFSIISWLDNPVDFNCTAMSAKVLEYASKD